MAVLRRFQLREVVAVRPVREREAITSKLAHPAKDEESPSRLFKWAQ